MSVRAGIVPIAFAWAATAVAAQSSPPSPGATVLRPNDAIRITVWRDAELSGEFTIGPDGYIQHPMYREIRAGGVPLEELDDLIRKFLSRRDAEPQFIVEPLFNVAVLGEVREPRLYMLSPAATVLEAVASAGGAQERGRLDRVILHRGGSRVELDLVHEEGHRAMAVMSGDQVEVTRRGPNVMQTYVGPIASLLAAVATVITLLDSRSP